jgi:hypothetical protein
MTESRSISVADSAIGVVSSGARALFEPTKFGSTSPRVCVWRPRARLAVYR